MMPLFHMVRGFLSQTLAEKHFRQTLSFSCPHKTHSHADLQESKSYPWEIFQRPNTYEVASDFRTPALTSSGLDICTQHPPPPRWAGQTQTSEDLGKTQKSLFTTPYGHSESLLSNTKLFHCIPLLQPHASKSQETSSPQCHHCPGTASSKFSQLRITCTEPRSIKL